MKSLTRVLLASALLGVCVAGASSTLAAGSSARLPQEMSPVRPLTDDKCDSACDAASDKCSIEAGKDAAKQRQCDANYDSCLRACQGQG